jgi:isovaleryl-CoA dehydrogenase
MRTSAARLPDGSWRLNGGKMWITNGAISDTELGDRFLVMQCSVVYCYLSEGCM